MQNMLQKKDDEIILDSDIGILSALDYLKNTNQPNSVILFNHELFYVYLFLSLKDFIVGISADFCDRNHLIFNPGAYQRYGYLVEDKSYTIVNKNDKWIKKNILSFNNNNYSDSINLSLPGYTQLFFGNNIGLMNLSQAESDFEFLSPNKIYHATKSQYQPSVLGNYYFKLSDNKDIYVEFYPRIYPNINHPPEFWSLEMLKKIELKF